MSRVFDEVELRFSCLVTRDWVLAGAREQSPGWRARDYRGGLSRPGREGPARRGSLDRPGGFSCRQPRSVQDRPVGVVLECNWLWLDTADLTNALVLSWATEMLGDRPFLRAGSHGVLRPQPDGLIQFDGHATRVGATAILELASWLCPSVLTRPRDAGSESRRLAARSRRV